MFFLTELSLVHYSIIMGNNPLKLVTFVVYVARCTIRLLLGMGHSSIILGTLTPRVHA